MAEKGHIAGVGPATVAEGKEPGPEPPSLVDEQTRVPPEDDPLQDGELTPLEGEEERDALQGAQHVTHSPTLPALHERADGGDNAEHEAQTAASGKVSPSVVEEDENGLDGSAAYNGDRGLGYDDGGLAAYDGVTVQSGLAGSGRLHSYGVGDGVTGRSGASTGALAATERQMAEERERHEAQLKLEAKAREELEDMILRIEKHFKAEQAARKKAEEMLQASIAAEVDAKSKAEDVIKKRAQEQRLLEDERAAVKRERMALETMRKEFESELHAARSEVAKAQDALAASEERIRATEQLERARLEADYQGRLAAMAAEVDRMREELGYRTAVMGQEMEKWRQQATLTANAVLEAKHEVMERKKELDATKEKMDRLLDKLLVGRERGIELSGAIASNQRMMSYMPGGVFMGRGGPGGAQQHGSMAKLPPLKQQQSLLPHAHVPPASQTWGSAAAPATLTGGITGIPAMYDQSATSGMAAGGAATGRNASSATRRNAARNQQQHQQSTHQHTDSMPLDLAHVQSKFARDAAEKSMANKAAARQRANLTAKQHSKPDRFAEAEREQGRLAGMVGSRWG